MRQDDITLAIIKPDAVSRKLVGEIISRLERKGFELLAVKVIKMDRKLAEKFYEEHKGKEFYERLINFMTSGKSIALVLKRENAVPVLRHLAGETDPNQAAPGTIRGDLGIGLPANTLHASDSAESAKREIEILFPEFSLYI